MVNISKRRVVHLASHCSWVSEGTRNLVPVTHMSQYCKAEVLHTAKNASSATYAIGTVNGYFSTGLRCSCHPCVLCCCIAHCMLSLGTHCGCSRNTFAVSDATSHPVSAADATRYPLFMYSILETALWQPPALLKECIPTDALLSLQNDIRVLCSS